MSKYSCLIVACFFCAPVAVSQRFSEAIEDNSFLIEEAYNQEDRVVQHISTALFQNQPRVFIGTFTEEWPVNGREHQLSYTIPYESLHPTSRGLGDIAINYRYQIWGEGDWAWLAPRVSVVLPTGDVSHGLGNGVLGVQVNVPMSKRWTNGLVTHFNAGFNLLPNAKVLTSDGNIVRGSLGTYSAGASAIWLASANLNVLCESLYSVNSNVHDNSTVSTSSVSIISPGVRFAVNAGSLQIVPGVAVPVVLGQGRVQTNIFGYLSFEHPF